MTTALPWPTSRLGSSRSPGLLETITLEHGVRYDDAGLAERLERLRDDGDQALLGETWSMTQADIDDMLGRCEADPALRSRFLALALGALEETKAAW